MPEQCLKLCTTSFSHILSSSIFTASHVALYNDSAAKYTTHKNTLYLPPFPQSHLGHIQWLPSEAALLVPFLPCGRWCLLCGSLGC